MLKKIATSSAIVFALSTSPQSSAAGLSTQVKANGAGGSVYLSPQNPFSIQVGVQPGIDFGRSADWWFVAGIEGKWYDFDLSTGQWRYAGTRADDLRPTYQGPLLTIGLTDLYSSPPFTPAGKYDVYFGVDLDMNGALDGSVIYDHVRLNIVDTTIAQVRAATLAANSYIGQIANQISSIVESTAINLSCDFRAAVSSQMILNGNTHQAYANGQALLYRNGVAQDCNTLFANNDVRVDSAVIKGNGSISGSDLSISAGGNFSLTGNYGYLLKASPYGVFISDYFYIDGSGSISGIQANGVTYPDVVGTADGVTVDVAEALSLFEHAGSVNRFALGDIASVIKAGNIYASTVDCPNIVISFTGTAQVKISTDCTAPASFFLDMNSGEILYY